MNHANRVLTVVFFIAAVLAFTGCVKKAVDPVSDAKPYLRSAIPQTEAQQAAQTVSEVDKDLETEEIPASEE